MSTEPRQPINETEGSPWELVRLPYSGTAAPWMEVGKTYRVVLRRWSTLEKPEFVVFDVKSGKLLDTLPWAEGADLFGITG